MAELDDVMALLTQVLADPSAFAERLAEQAVTRFAHGPDGAGRLDGDRVVDAERVVDAAGFTTRSDNDNNILLAAALGACECWGAEITCPDCGGAGAAGWTEPDVALFQKFVGPAVERLSAADVDAGAGRRAGTSQRGSR